MIDDDIKEIATIRQRLNRKWKWLEQRVREQNPDLYREYVARFCKDQSGRKTAKNRGKIGEKSGQNQKTALQPVSTLSTTTLADETRKVIARYCECFKQRYKVNPPINGKATGLIQGLTKDLGSKQAIMFVEAYLRMNEQVFVKRRHPVDGLVNNLNAIVDFAQNNRIVTHKEAQLVESDAKNVETMKGMI